MTRKISEGRAVSVTGNAKTNRGKGGGAARRKTGRGRADGVDDVRDAGRNAKGIEASLRALKAAGRLEKVDEARITALRSIAAALDENPQNAQMWKEYRESFEALTADDSDAPSDFARLLEQLRP